MEDGAVESIFEQASIFHTLRGRGNVPERLVIEGKIPNAAYPVKGPMAIDLYEGYDNPMHLCPTHEVLERLFVLSGGR